MKKIISLFLCLLLIVTCISVPINAVESPERTTKYEIVYNVLDTGMISMKENNEYDYCGGSYDFSFKAYYLKDYATTENLLILDTADEDILYAAIDMMTNSLEYVIRNGNKITSYVVFDLKITYQPLSKNNFKTGSSIVYHSLTVDEDYDKFVSLAKTIVWFTAYTAENANPVHLSQDYCMAMSSSSSNRGATSISFSGSGTAVNDALMTVGIYFPDSCITTVGCFSGKTTDISGDIAGAYCVETYYDPVHKTYVSMVAVWDIDYSIIQSIDKSCLEAIGTMTKKFNLFFEYNNETNIASVITAAPTSSFLMTRNFATMFRIYGSYNYAYIGEYSFNMHAGGESGPSSDLLSIMFENLLGERLGLSAYLTSINIFIEVLNAIDSVSFSMAKQAYEVINNSTIGYARTIASIYNRVLYKKYAICEARALIYQYPSNMYGGMKYQVEFDVVHITSDGSSADTTHHIRINHNKSIVVPK